MAKPIRNKSLSGLNIEHGIKKEANDKSQDNLNKFLNKKTIETKKEEDPKEEPKVELKEDPKEEPKVELKEEPKEEPKEELKEELKPAKKVATSITLDEDVLNVMQIYCKANKLSFSGEINKYLKNQYIPKKKVKEFLKNMFS